MTIFPHLPPLSTLILAGSLIPAFTGCSRQDDNFIPYELKGFNIYVYDNKNDKEFYEGQVESNYQSRISGLNSCQVRAKAAAEQKQLSNWSYICCTITSTSTCATKVR